MSALTQEEAKLRIEQNYAVPLRTLLPINGKRFCKTGEYVIAETSYASVKYAAYENLAKVKHHLINTEVGYGRHGVCEHIENFESGEYYCMNEAVPLEIYSTSVFSAEQVRCYFRRTRPCVGARRQLQSMTILRDCQQELDAKWVKFESSVAEFAECVPPDRNNWKKMPNVGGPAKLKPEDVTCKCMNCIKKNGPNGKVFRDNWTFNCHNPYQIATSFES